MYFPVFSVTTFSKIELSAFASNKKICRKTRMLYLQKSVRHVQSKIKTTSLDQTTIVLDVGSSRSMHSSGLSAAYPSGSTVDYNQALIKFYSSESKELQDTDDHANISEFVLQLLGDEKECAAETNGDNINVNSALSRELGF